MKLKAPYLIFLGDAQSDMDIKMGRSLVYWRQDLCAAEYSFREGKMTLGLPQMSLKEAEEAGIKSIVIGLNNPGGELKEAWLDFLIQASNRGFDIINGMHTKLNDLLELKQNAKGSLIDLRETKEKYFVGTGEKRSGVRILTVGTDCMVGKMFTALAITKALQAKGINAKFKATGQCGMMINAGEGIPLDAIPCDFISGAVEELSPSVHDKEVHIIEGQGSLLHPSFAGVTLGLVHGAQPDYLILCHDPSRELMRGKFERRMPTIKDCWELYLQAARVTNPKVRYLGVSLNTSKLSESERVEVLNKLQEEVSVPVFDPNLSLPDTVLGIY